MSELLLQELQTLARVNLNDHFIYQIGQPQSEALFTFSVNLLGGSWSSQPDPSI